ncbi:O-antigen ligase family protein [Marinobacter sp. GN3S48]|uniref:O-antigen ligase family protein n=1 Tax=Marinobacter sp. GN3S48 TaxID=3382302 RepID=UPI00387B3BAE
MIMTENFRLRSLFIFLGVALVSAFMLGIIVGSAHLAYDLNRFVLIAVLTIVVAIELPRIKVSSICNDKVTWFGISIFLFSAVVSDILSDSSLFQLSNIFLFSFFWFFVIGGAIFESFGQGVVFARRLICLVVALFSIICLLVLVFWVISKGKLALTYAVLNAGYVNINFFGQIATWIIPLYCVSIIEGFDRGFRGVALFLFVLLILLWIFVLSLSVRGTLLSVVLAGLAVPLFFRAESRRFLKVFFGALLIAIVIWFFYESMNSGIESQKVQLVQLNPIGRLMLWKEAMLMSLVNFPFGMGSESWVTHSELSDGFYRPRAQGHPHNMYLLWAAEYGWLAVIGVLVIVAGFFKKILLYKKLESLGSSKNLGSNEVLVGLVASSFAGMVHAGVSGVLLVPSSMILGGIVLALTHGILFSAVNKEVETLLTSGWWKFFQFVIGLSCGVIALLFIINASKYYSSMSLDEQRYFGNGEAVYFPRFWVHGNAVDVRGSYQIVESEQIN